MLFFRFLVQQLEDTFSLCCQHLQSHPVFHNCGKKKLSLRWMTFTLDTLMSWDDQWCATCQCACDVYNTVTAQSRPLKNRMKNELKSTRIHPRTSGSDASFHCSRHHSKLHALHARRLSLAPRSDNPPLSADVPVNKHFVGQPVPRTRAGSFNAVYSSPFRLPSN